MSASWHPTSTENLSWRLLDYLTCPACLLEARWAAITGRFRRRAALILQAAAEGLIDYLTCPACWALVPIPGDASWPDTCPRCGRCV